ncbi:hypothetical protein [Shouchella lonarensis]|uniref:Uncharacterized protein n=1 Tax=Shouchella lonarensis TaxID=1464122 RepID=A0A1G6HAX6_9BACI|nr:hypothetical protein [Shouchella lonarensis]SDB91432.1 hypothetical protein SAMN05421737_103135 [Shouchella lonarensis]
MEGYTFSQFIEDLESGNEFKFEFNNREYRIYWRSDGVCFTQDGQVIYYKIEKKPIAGVKIEGCTLEEIINQQRWESVVIYDGVDPDWIGRYTFTDFVEDLEIGHEFQFNFHDKEYHISWVDDGVLFTYEGDSTQYETVKELIAHVKINSNTLKEVINNKKWTNVNMF